MSVTIYGRVSIDTREDVLTTGQRQTLHYVMVKAHWGEHVECTTKREATEVARILRRALREARKVGNR